jgi:peroxiredoxin Q/BCP
MKSARLFSAATAALLLTLTSFGQEPADKPAAGEKAPAFRLQDQTGAWHSLEQYRGKWLVLYFYPKDNTPGCTTQACEIRDNIFAFRQAGAVILGVSVDDVASHKGFAEEHSLPFPLLADSSKRASADYGVLITPRPDIQIARRDTFIIDPNGTIARRFSKVAPKGHSELVLAEIRALTTKS